MRAMYSILAICIGASLGALSRWGLALWLTPGGMIPWGTLAANLVTGFLGALTTFSTFSAEVVIYLLENRYGLAVFTTLVHVMGTLLMTVAGIKSAAYFMALRAG